ncbi:MAG: fibronectin type III domain-containing protein [Nitrospirae bacterium]|nr:fibronectin type III domain-containing protein [Nitrospirota bacterium]
MKTIITSIALLILLPLTACAASLKLQWDAPTMECGTNQQIADQDIGGYKLNYRLESETAYQTVDVGKVTTYTLTGLKPAVYCVNAESYGAVGAGTCGVSNEVCKRAEVMPGAPVNMN